MVRYLGMLSERAAIHRLREVLEHPAYRPLVELSRRPGLEVFVVGGAVRDVLLDHPIKDVDFVVRGVALSKLERILRRAGHVALVGKRFGVLKFRARDADQTVDVALPRTDHPPTGGGHGGYRDVRVLADPDLAIEDDLKRRDFTVNAMAFDVAGRRLIDPFKGMADLKAGLVRAVGNPEVRFSEDYTRMLRAVRFTVRLGFSLEPHTLLVIQKNARNLNRVQGLELDGAPHHGERVVPWEVVGREVGRALYADARRTLNLLEETRLLPEVLPEIDRLRWIKQDPKFHPEGDVLTHTKQCLERLYKINPRPSFNLIVTVLFHDVGKATNVQVRDRKTRATVPIPHPREFFASGKYEPVHQRLMNIGHPEASAKIAKKIFTRLVWSQFTRDERLQFSEADVLHNLKYHLLLDIERTRPSRAEQILFYPGGGVRWDLLTLARVDGGPTSERYPRTLDRVNQLLSKKLDLHARGRLPLPLLTGRDLIRLGAEPGPRFKVVLAKLRDAQLAGRIRDRGAARQLARELLAKRI